MARLSPEKILEIQQSVDIVDVISSYINVEKKGRDYKAICPFHDDTNPSLSISTSRQIYKCFVCGAGGNVFTFLQEYLHISYIEAVKQVAKIGGIDLSEYHLDSPVKQVNPKLLPLYQMHEEASIYYKHLLNTKKGIMAYEYLARRNITEDLIEKFSIGYSGVDNQLVSVFTKLEYSKVDMAKSGLVIEGDNGYYDRFKDRIMFALHDMQGKVIGFSGRIYKENQEGAKYINSPESDIFIKSKTLYNYHRAKDKIKKEGFVYLLEGFMDVIALSKIGIDNTLAIMGTSLTNDHLKMIRQQTNNIYIALDGDNAGQHAALKSAKLLIANNFNVKMIKLMNGLDPDEILTKFGEETLKISLNTLISPIEFEIDYLYNITNFDNYEEKRSFLEKSCALIKDTNDLIDLNHFINLISNKSGFDVDFIKEYLGSIRLSHPKITKVKSYQTSNKASYSKMSKYEKAERHLLFYMVKDKQVAIIYEKKLGFMLNANNRIIASYIVDYYHYHSTVNEADLISHMPNNELVKYLVDILEQQLPLKIDLSVIDDYVSTLKEYTKQCQIADLKKKIKLETDIVKKAELAQQIQVLIKN